MRFDRKWQRRRKLARGWRRVAPFLALAGFGALAWYLWQQPSRGGNWQSASAQFTLCGQGGSSRCVIDGDTLAIGRRKIRLTGYDAPEMDGDCAAERDLARRARMELRNWLNAAPYALDGGDDPPRDKYGRELRAARRMVDGKEIWLSDHMISAGLARDNGWGAGPAQWCEGG